MKRIFIFLFVITVMLLSSFTLCFNANVISDDVKQVDFGNFSGGSNRKKA